MGELQQVGKTKRGSPIYAYDEKGRPVFGYHPKTGKPICAKTKSNKEPCLRMDRMQNGRCEKHGGRAAAGIASPNFKHGKFRGVPEKILPTYDEVRNDPELLHLRDSIALTYARINELLEGADHGESGELWRAGRAKWVEVKDALASGEGIPQAMRSMDRFVSYGVDESYTWREIDKLHGTIQRLTTAEHKRLVETGEMVKHDQVRMLMASLQASLVNRIGDPETVGAIWRDVKEDYRRAMGR